MIKYGLKHKETGRLLGWLAHAHHDNRGAYTSYSLGLYGRLWLVNAKEEARDTRVNSPSKPSTCYLEPQHDYKPDELEVVTINMEICND